MFIFIVAGHETSAYALTFLFAMLAFFPDVQEKIQADVDRIMGSREPDRWSYREDFPKLSAGWPGAVLNEVGRIFGATSLIPRGTGNRAISFDINGQQRSIPANTTIHMSLTAVHRHPGIWPAKAATEIRGFAGEKAPYPLSNFHPEIWLKDQEHDNMQAFTPPRGSLMTFGEGARSCSKYLWIFMVLKYDLTQMYSGPTLRSYRDHGHCSASAQVLYRRTGYYKVFSHTSTIAS